MKNVTPKKGKITPENINEAAKLLAIWESTKNARAERGFGSQEKFGAEFNIGNQAAVGFFLHGQTALSPKAAAGFARGLGCAVSDFSPRLARLLDVDAGWTRPQHLLAGESPGRFEVAQNLSHHQYSHQVLETTWEKLMVSVPDSLFTLHLRDDALAPEHPRGTRVVWRPGRKLAARRLVLLRDAHGDLHARVLYATEAPGQWHAKATHAAFLSFEVPSASVHVLAVHQGFLDPDD